MPIFMMNEGHWYTSLLADASARWREIYGNAVILVTGYDEHGMKIKARRYQTKYTSGAIL
mgnify:CR=1 FL=1